MRAPPLCLLIVLMGPPASSRSAERFLWELPDNDQSRQAVCPPWAFEMWMWEDDQNTAEAVWDYVNGCAKHDIPLRVVLIDSPWSTAYNDFTWDTQRYPEPKKMIDALHARGLRVVLWMTCMVNPNEHKADCPGSAEDIYREAKAKGYLCNDGKLRKWWKGRGAFIDYTHPEAVAWWHARMDRVLLQGIDGWKVDGAAELFFPVGGRGHKGPIDLMEYVDLCYRDCYRHLLHRNPEGVTMVRSVDTGQGAFGGRHAPRDAAPVTWVGDQSKTWDDRGLGLALESAFRAMKKGYSVVGSDIGGFSGGAGQKIDRTLFLRWMQWSAFMPFFLNGGHGDHRPWMYDAEFLRIFRRFAWIHHELSPYFYSHVREANHGGPCLLRVMPGRWQYMLGDSLLVAVIDRPDARRAVELPAGRWIDYWDNAVIHIGPKRIEVAPPEDRYPVFVRGGSIIPLNVANDNAGRGTRASAGRVTLDIYPDPDAPAAFSLWSPAGKVTKLSAGHVNDALQARISGGETRRYILRILTTRRPVSVTIDGAAADSGAWRYDEGDRRLWIETKAISDARIAVALEPPNEADSR